MFPTCYLKTLNDFTIQEVKIHDNIHERCMCMTNVKKPRPQDSCVVTLETYVPYSALNEIVDKKEVITLIEKNDAEMSLDLFDNINPNKVLVTKEMLEKDPDVITDLYAFMSDNKNAIGIKGRDVSIDTARDYLAENGYFVADTLRKAVCTTRHRIGTELGEEYTSEELNESYKDIKKRDLTCKRLTVLSNIQNNRGLHQRVSGTWWESCNKNDKGKLKGRSASCTSWMDSLHDIKKLAQGERSDKAEDKDGQFLLNTILQKHGIVVKDMSKYEKDPDLFTQQTGLIPRSKLSKSKMGVNTTPESSASARLMTYLELPIELVTDCNRDNKSSHGYSEAKVERQRTDLETVFKLVTTIEGQKDKIYNLKKELTTRITDARTKEVRSDIKSIEESIDKNRDKIVKLGSPREIDNVFFPFLEKGFVSLYGEDRNDAKNIKKMDNWRVLDHRVKFIDDGIKAIDDVSLGRNKAMKPTLEDYMARYYTKVVNIGGRLEFSKASPYKRSGKDVIMGRTIHYPKILNKEEVKCSMTFNTRRAFDMFREGWKVQEPQGRGKGTKTDVKITPDVSTITNAIQDTAGIVYNAMHLDVDSGSRVGNVRRNFVNFSNPLALTDIVGTMKSDVKEGYIFNGGLVDKMRPEGRTVFLRRRKNIAEDRHGVPKIMKDAKIYGVLSPLSTIGTKCFNDLKEI